MPLHIGNNILFTQTEIQIKVTNCLIIYLNVLQIVRDMSSISLNKFRLYPFLKSPHYLNHIAQVFPYGAGRIHM